MDTTNNTNGMTEMGEDHAMVASMGQMPAMALVELSDVTHTAVQSGAWSDPNTWADGLIPDDAARAHIPEGLTVIIDGIFSEELKTLRLDGVLSFANDTDTELRLDTLVTMPGSHLIIGTETAPISADVDARIVFADDGAIDQTWDPTLISRGALIHGETTIFGAEKLAFTSLETPVSAGSTSIMLSEDPTGWRVGDEITIAGTEAGNPLSDEVVTITQIVGRVVTFAQALQYDHVPPRADLDVHVANLTRNVQFSSENSETGHAGHVMFMHTNDADIRYFSMEGLGRTDKALGVDDWQLASPSEGSLGPELTEVLELGGDNVRGRYSLHFHRGGDDTPAAHVEGAVVRDDPGWAYVNHSSNVDFIGNVSHNVVGAAYNTEAGDEIGSFIGNIAIRTYNPNGDPNPPDFELNEDQSPDIRVLTQDFGWQGDGFWLHGPGVVVDNNVVAGASGHAYIYWPLGLVEEGLGEALAEVDIDGVPVEVRPKQIEVPSFDGNIAYGAPKALNVAYLHTDNRDDNDEHQVLEGLLAPVPQSYEDQLQSTFSNFTAWNIDLNAIAAPYSGRLTFENIDIIGTGVGGSIGVKLDQFDNENDITVRNVTIDGFEVGLAAQRQGEGLIDGARIAANGSDIRISMPDGAPRELDIRNVEFLDESLIFSDMSERVNINMDAAHDLGLAGGLFGDPEGFFDEENLINVPPIFLPDRITYQTADGEVVGLYFDLQDPNFIPVVPDGELSRFVSEDIVGLTNSELYEQYGFAAGGVPAPSNISQGLADGGFSGAPAELNATFPPEPNEYWVDYLAQFGVEIPWQEPAYSPESESSAHNDIQDNEVSQGPAIRADDGGEPSLAHDDNQGPNEVGVSDAGTDPAANDDLNAGDIAEDIGEEDDGSGDPLDALEPEDSPGNGHGDVNDGSTLDNGGANEDGSTSAVQNPEADRSDLNPDRDEMDQLPEFDRDELDRRAELDREEANYEPEFEFDGEQAGMQNDAGDTHEGNERHLEGDQWLFDLLALLMRLNDEFGHYGAELHDEEEPYIDF